MATDPTPTAEERARLIRGRISDGSNIGMVHRCIPLDSVEQWILDEIRAAVEAQKEKDARIAEEYELVIRCTEAGVVRIKGTKIAAAIRGQDNGS